VDLLGLFFCLIYYWFYVRKYENFKGRLSQGWLATGLLFTKLILMLLIAFQWTGTKLGVKFSELQGYPNFLIMSDLLHMFCWLCVTVVAYLEWNRNLRTGFVMRIFFLISTIVFFIKLHSIVNQWHVSPTTINYFNNVGVNIGIACVYAALSLLVTLGALPKLNGYLEADESLSQLAKEVVVSPDEKPASIREFGRLISGPGSRTALCLILIGVVAAAGKGFLMQAVNYFDGKMFDFARAGKINELLYIIFQTTILYLFYSIGSGIVMLTCTLGSEKIVNGTNGIRNRMFNKLLKQEMAYHDSTTTGAIASQFSNDAERVKQILAEAIPTFVENMSLVLFGLIFLFRTAVESHAPWLPVYMIGLVPLTFGASYYQAERLEAYEEEAQAGNSASSAKVQDVFSKYHTVIVYGKRVWESTAYAKVVKVIYNVLRPRNVFNGVITSVTGFLSFGTQILAFFLGVELYRTVSFGAFITFCLYAMNIVFGLIEVIKLVPLIGQTIGGSNAVIRLLERQEQAPEASPVPLLDLHVTEGAIEFKDVIFTYPNVEDKTKPTIGGISFKVAPRSKVALIGDSGAGKTTIVQLIARFYDVEHGSILIDGQNIKNCSTSSIRQNLALVGQSTGLFATTILENIVYGAGDPEDGDNVQEMYEILSTLHSGDVIAPKHRHTVDNVLKAAEQSSALDFVQGKLDMQLGEGGSGLSGGQRQRVTVARALYKNSPILLLDEVTSALDQVSEAVVQKAIDRLTDNRTVLIVAHRLHTIQNADKIIVLEKGKIVAEGKHEDLLESSEKYRKMVQAAQQKEATKYENTLTSRAIDLLRGLNKDIEFEEDLQALRGAISSLIGTADAQVKETADVAASVRLALRSTAPAPSSSNVQEDVALIDLDDSDSDSDGSDGSDDDHDDALLPPRDPRRQRSHQ
jgi:ATP-binding cassette subfamily B protein